MKKNNNINSLIIESHAKINIGLEILAQRDDGYHEIRSIFQEINWGDQLILEKISSGIEFKTNIPELNNFQNLCYKAAQLMAPLFPGGIRIQLNKKIPVGTGMGGGSSNAAAVIKGIDHLYKLNLTIDKKIDIAARLGSDVPFFIFGKTAHVAGRGEIITPVTIESLPKSVVIVLPGLCFSTSHMYKKAKNNLTSPEKSIIISATFAEALDRNKLNDLKNDFEPIAFYEHPELEVVKNALLRGGCEVAMMTGSGSAFYGLYDGSFEILPALESFKIVKTKLVK